MWFFCSPGARWSRGARRRSCSPSHRTSFANSSVVWPTVRCRFISPLPTTSANFSPSRMREADTGTLGEHDRVSRGTGFGGAFLAAPGGRLSACDAAPRFDFEADLQRRRPVPGHHHAVRLVRRDGAGPAGIPAAAAIRIRRCLGHGGDHRPRERAGSGGHGAAVGLRDINEGIVKSCVFGVACSLIAVYEGYYATPTAEGVGRATTRTVVTSAVFTLFLDYLITAAFL